ncbi:MAG: ribonuclease E [Ilumatobacter sp.]|jgi:ribonuclease E
MTMTVSGAITRCSTPSRKVPRRTSAEGIFPMEHSDDNEPAGSQADSSASSAEKSADQPAKQRQRGSRGGQNRKPASQRSDETAESNDRNDVEIPDRIREGKPSAEAAERGLVRKPKIGDTRSVPFNMAPGSVAKQHDDGERDGGENDKQRKNRRGRGTGKEDGGGGYGQARESQSGEDNGRDDGKPKSRQGDKQGKNQKNRRGRGKGRGKGDTQQMDDAWLEQRRGRERNGKPIGRYFMCVQARPGLAQVAVLEGRNLIEHYVSRPSDDVAQIHGNIYIGRVQNVLPGMEAAFVDIATPKNAVLYRSDVQYEPEDIEVKGSNLRIEDILKNKQLILCQVTKNPIAHKGARLTQEVSLPGRFVVLIPNSQTYGISKRLPDDVRKRLREILDRVKPDEHGIIVRTAAESATEEELIADMTILLKEWAVIESKAAKAQRPGLLYREPELAVRVIREEFNADYRGVLIDDKRLWQDVHDYVAAFNPDLADRVEYYDADKEGLSLFERHHVHEQVHKALDRKVWLPSGGSLIIEGTEALTVIDVNTGKNVGKSNLEETVFHNNMEAAVEVAKQLRLRDIGGIIVIDFVDMEIRENRGKVVEALRDSLARDKTRSQVFDVSELGLVEMTRKRIGEGLLTEYSEICPDCDGRGVVVDYSMLK